MVVLYDGDCGFCNRVVAFVLKYEKRVELNFASLESKFASKLFNDLAINDPDKSTFYFYDGVTLYYRSTAAIELSKRLKFPVSVLRIGVVFPKGFRDKIYDFVAHRRGRIVKNYCFVPTKDMQDRFLD